MADSSKRVMESNVGYAAILARINGHEYVKRQLQRRGIAYEPLDNGILSCQDTRNGD